MGVRLRLIVEYTWDHKGDEISALDLQNETHDWITQIVGKTDMVFGGTNPTFKLERIKP